MHMNLGHHSGFPSTIKSRRETHRLERLTTRPRADVLSAAVAARCPVVPHEHVQDCNHISILFTSTALPRRTRVALQDDDCTLDDMSETVPTSQTTPLKHREYFYRIGTQSETIAEFQTTPFECSLHLCAPGAESIVGSVFEDISSSARIIYQEQSHVQSTVIIATSRTMPFEGLDHLRIGAVQSARIVASSRNSSLQTRDILCVTDDLPTTATASQTFSHGMEDNCMQTDIQSMLVDMTHTMPPRQHEAYCQTGAKSMQCAASQTRLCETCDSYGQVEVVPVNVATSQTSSHEKCGHSHQDNVVLAAMDANSTEQCKSRNNFVQTKPESPCAAQTQTDILETLNSCSQIHAPALLDAQSRTVRTQSAVVHYQVGFTMSMFADVKVDPSAYVHGQIRSNRRRPRTSNRTHWSLKNATSEIKPVACRQQRYRRRSSYSQKLFSDFVFRTRQM